MQRLTTLSFVASLLLGCSSESPDPGPPDSSSTKVDASPADAGPPPGHCGDSAPCPAGTVCTGVLCGVYWRCEPPESECGEIAAYCGCDGVTFHEPRGCPTREYTRASSCEVPLVSCDPRSVVCTSPAPSCPDGEVPSVNGGCWGDCVPMDGCACAELDECPPAPPGIIVTCTTDGHCAGR